MYVVTDYYTVGQPGSDRHDPERRALIARARARKDDRR
jgi:hypothetical protein